MTNVWSGRKRFCLLSINITFLLLSIAYCPPVLHLSFDIVKGAYIQDESGNSNTAMLKNGAEIVYEGGKCDSGASLLGKYCLLKGELTTVDSRYLEPPLSRTSLYLEQFFRSLSIDSSLIFSLYLELSLSRTNSLVTCEFEIERVR